MLYDAKNIRAARQFLTRYIGFIKILLASKRNSTKNYISKMSKIKCPHPISASFSLYYMPSQNVK